MNKDTVITVRIDQDTMAHLLEVSTIQNKTVSQIIREYINGQLKKQEND
jgi:predicted transcriptional regulator